MMNRATQVTIEIIGGDQPQESTMDILPITSIKVDPGIQLASRQIDGQTVVSYVEAMTNGDAFPPLTVFSDGDNHWLSAGFHRLAAYRFLGHSEVPVTVHPGTRQDAMIFAATDNAQHGRPMTQAQKHEAGERLLRLTDWSDGEIARRLSVNRSTVTYWRQELSSEVSLDSLRTVTRGGTTYEMDVGNIGLHGRGGKEEGEAFYRRWSRDNAELGLDAFGDPIALPEDSEPAVPRDGSSMAVHYSSETSEWYTPQHIIERVLQTLGEIDLDPCSNSHIRPNVPAKQHLTAQDNGLAHSWQGRVYMNPPYGREIVQWVEYLCQMWDAGNILEAIALVPARTDTEWFRLLRRFPRCFIWGRLKFNDSALGAPFPSMAVYLGNDLLAFRQAFSDIGDIYTWLEHDE